MAIDAQAELRGWLGDALGIGSWRYDVQTAMQIADAPGKANVIAYRLMVWRASPLVGGPPIMCGVEMMQPPTMTEVRQWAATAIAAIDAKAKELASPLAKAGGR